MTKDRFVRLVKAEAQSLLSLTRISVEHALLELDETHLKLNSSKKDLTNENATNVGKFVFLNLLEQIMEEVLSTIETDSQSPKEESFEEDLEEIRSNI